MAYQDLRLERPEWSSRSDSQRDAEKYRQLVRALRHATSEIRSMERRGQGEIEAVLVKLLPDMAAALNGLRAFIIRLDIGRTVSEPAYELLRYFAKDEWPCRDFAVTPLLQQVIASQQPRVIDSLDGESDQLIRGLEFCQATSAILAPLQIIDQYYLIGICNKYDSSAGPFLASDRMTLENLLELIAIGARASERSRRELTSIEHISKVATVGSPQEVAEAIVMQAVVLTDALYASLWTVNKHSMQLEFLTVHHAELPWWRPYRRTLPVDETSFIGFVALHGKSLYLAEMPTAPEQQPGDDEAAAAFCMPLIFNGQTLGVLYLASSHTDGIRHEERRFVERLAPHAAIALHNTRLIDIRQRISRFQEDISDIMGLDDQLEQMLAHLERQVDLSGFFLAIYNSDTHLIEFPVAYDHGQSVHPLLHQAGAFYGPQQPGQQRMGFVEWVLQHRKTLLVDNFATWPERYGIDPRARAGVKSCLVTPLLRNGRIVGAIGLRGYTDSPGSFDEYDQRFLEGIATHIAIVLDNSRRYDRTQLQLEEANAQLHQRISELRAVSEFQRRISDIDEEAKEIENIYNEARRAMQTVGLDTSNMYIGLYDEKQDEIWFPLAYEYGNAVSEATKARHELYQRTRLGNHGSVAEWIMRRWQREHNRTPVLINTNFRGWLQTQGLRAFATDTSCWLGAPMIYKDKLVGMIGLRGAQHEQIFKEEHKELVATIASQAAIAIANARLYALEKHEVRQFRALHQAGKAINKAGVHLDDVLQAILEQATEVTGAFFGTLQRVVDDQLEFRAAWPIEERDKLQQRFGRMPINGPGITARAVRLNDAQLVTDVQQDPEFVAGLPETRSELAVVLRRGGEVDAQPIGVLNVEHRQVGGLTMENRAVLIGLSNLAVIAIENAQHAEQLSRSNTIAVMGAWGADIVHDIQREVAHIRLAIEILRSADEVPHALLLMQLAEMDKYITNLIMPELPERLLNGEVQQRLDRCYPDRVINAEVADLRRKHSRVQFHLALECPAVEAYIHEQWLRRLLRHLVLNAVRANEGEAGELIITIGTQLTNDMIEIWVRDNGRGIRPEIVDSIFKRPIQHINERSQERHGRGLLLVHHIVELHGGKSWIKGNEVGQGACIAFAIPQAAMRQPQ